MFTSDNGTLFGRAAESKVAFVSHSDIVVAIVVSTVIADKPPPPKRNFSGMDGFATSTLTNAFVPVQMLSFDTASGLVCNRLILAIDKFVYLFSSPSYFLQQLLTNSPERIFLLIAVRRLHLLAVQRRLLTTMADSSNVSAQHKHSAVLAI